MSLLVKGITRLSELQIDITKDFGGFGLYNLLQVAVGMTKGDLTVRDDAVLGCLPPGPAAYVLTSQGALKLPYWAPPPGPLKYFFGAPIDSMVATAKPTIDRDIDGGIKSPGTSYNSAIVPTFAPAMASSVATAKPAVDKTVDTTRSPGRVRTYVVMDAMGGALFDDGGVQTDQTVAANNDTVNDMTLLPAGPAINDAYYFGYAASIFLAIWLRQGISGAGDWSIIWEYWDGAAWSTLPNIDDNGGGFRPGVANFRYRVGWTDPGDWALKVESGLNLYWARARVQNFVSIATQPKGTRCWIELATG